MAESKKHHYVPQHILKNFSIHNQKKRVFVLDAKERRVFKGAINNVACENDFNAYGDGDDRVNFESYFDENDHRSAIIINKIITNSNLSCLSQSEFEQLSPIVINQHLRTSFARNSMAGVIEQISNFILKHSVSKSATLKQKEIFKKYNPKVKVTEDGKKSFIHNFLATQTEEYSQILNSKKIFLIKSSEYDNFIISDNPICIIGDEGLAKGPYGHEGLLSPKVEIYYPISNNHCLALFCPLRYYEIQNMIDSYGYNTGEYFELYIAMGKNGVWNAPSDHVYNLNVLQMRQARRYAYSSCSRFGGLWPIK